MTTVRCAGIDFAEMTQEGHVGAGVGLQVGLAQRGEHLHRLAVLELGAREPLLVGFHPFGHKAGEAVLPAAEPQEDEVQVVFPRARQQPVHEREVVLAFLRLDPVPPETHEDGVEVHFHELRPDRVHVLEAGGGGVVRFAGQRQIRLAIDDQLGGRAAFFEMRQGGGGTRLRAAGGERERAERGGNGQVQDFHEGGFVVTFAVTRF